MPTRAHLAVLAAAVCFATTGSAVAIADVDASPLAVGALRVLVGGAVLGLVALPALGRRRGSENRRVGAGGLGLAAVGALGVLAYQPTFFAGTAANGVAVGTVVALGTAPVATGVLESVVRRRPPTVRWALATAVALAGVVLVGGVVGVDPGSVSGLGVAASFGAGASYAVYAVVGKVLLDRGWGPSTTMGSVFGLAALGSVPVLLLTAPPALLAPRGLALGLWLGLVTTALAYLLFGWGLARLRATTASTLTLAEPLTATLLGLLVLGERLGPVASAGLLLIALGIVVLTAPGRSGAAHELDEEERRAVAPA
ncbi:DMT family transporter [Nocardioides sp. CFH 31398]|uniref:DMT family transporter n=1 Tax=Nocardioides sp. CFH 31398 TaxID=2919579 RepID=UPI001F068192|nr:EamA family transporter [Nocardioides sp. CFH 31398]MCH1866820.1 DMT family transporter [Nocardioides sp. CFH 31398]